MMMRALTLTIIAALALSACDRRKKTDDLAFDGVHFSSKSERASKEERDRFYVTVKKANQSLDGAREAGRYGGTKYCIKEYGTSIIEWVVGPETENIVPVDDAIRLEGICRP